MAHTRNQTGAALRWRSAGTSLGSNPSAQSFQLVRASRARTLTGQDSIYEGPGGCLHTDSNTRKILLCAMLITNWPGLQAHSLSKIQFAHSPACSVSRAQPPPLYPRYLVTASKTISLTKLLTSLALQTFLEHNFFLFKVFTDRLVQHLSSAGHTTSHYSGVVSAQGNVFSPSWPPPVGFWNCRIKSWVIYCWASKAAHASRCCEEPASQTAYLLLSQDLLPVSSPLNSGCIEKVRGEDLRSI